MESIFNQKRKKKHYSIYISWFYFQKCYKNNRYFSAERVRESGTYLPSERDIRRGEVGEARVRVTPSWSTNRQALASRHWLAIIRHRIHMERWKQRSWRPWCCRSRHRWSSCLWFRHFFFFFFFFLLLNLKTINKTFFFFFGRGYRRLRTMLIEITWYGNFYKGVATRGL